MTLCGIGPVILSRPVSTNHIFFTVAFHFSAWNISMKRYLLVSALLLGTTVPVQAITVVYDSISGYVPENTPGASPSWLNGDIEQGIRISRSNANQRLIRAEFFFRSDFMSQLDTSATMRFYADTGGAPGTLLATVEDSIAVSAQSVEQVSIDLPDIVIPNDPVWITWLFGSSRHFAGVALGASPSIGREFATSVYRSRSSGEWVTLNNQFVGHGGGPALRLLAIPEPSGPLLCLTSIALMMLPTHRMRLYRL